LVFWTNPKTSLTLLPWSKKCLIYESFYL
jgi:hypothetical protein